MLNRKQIKIVVLECSEESELIFLGKTKIKNVKKTPKNCT